MTAAGSVSRTSRALVPRIAGTAAALLVALSVPGLAPAAGPFDTVTVLPCRVVDTRNGPGAIPANASRSFLVAGASLAGQGGAGSCNIPDGPAKGVYINVVAVAPSGGAHLTVHPYPTAVPLASTLNFRQGQTIANGVLVPICDQDTSACDFDLTVTMGPASAHVVIDVTGYLVLSP